MAAMDKDTRLVMTILFVGAVSGTNVYFYSAYGGELPFSNFAHAVLFGFLTVGGIMGLKFTGKRNKGKPNKNKKLENL